MKKFSKIGKRVLAFFLVALMNINTYATTTANDGSSFVTKAEFDDMMYDFNIKMNEYQSALNAKIDTAIANYLAGAAGTIGENREIVLKDSVSGVLSISSVTPLDYDYCMPSVRGNFLVYNQGPSEFNMNIIKVDFDGGQGVKGKKTVITNLNENGTNSTAAWKGYYTDVLDKVYCTWQDVMFVNGDPHEIEMRDNRNEIRGSSGLLIRNRNLVGKRDLLFNMVYTWGNGWYLWGQQFLEFHGDGFSTDWGTLSNKYVCVVKPYDYDMFTNYDRYYNWGYQGDYKTTFGGYQTKVVVPGYGTVTNDAFKRAIGTTHLNYTIRTRTGNETTGYTYGRANINEDPQIGNSVKNVVSTEQTIYLPLIGFEDSFLKNWKQIYNDETNDVANFEDTKHGHESGASSRGILKDGNNNKYLSLSAGYPLMKLNKGEKLTYTLNFEDKDVNYVVWFSNRPFSLDGHPDDDNCIDVEGLDKATYTNKGYVVVNGSGQFTVEYADEGYLYLKWGVANSDKTQISGGKLLPSQFGYVSKNK